MNKLFRHALLAVAITAGFSVAAQAANDAVPAPTQDPVVQHLKLSNEQVAKLEDLHKQFDSNIQSIKIDGFKDGALVEVVKSGKWDDAKVKQQLAAFGQLDQQVRYYRVKYYFGVNQVLTPEQRSQVKEDLAKALN
ncbi:Spy/CpxP family protein refolding chaperone [Enterobacteriaceae bacterium H11S18]|uniref:Spy/CpxP family protein refolding chaperone n=1 Tax=Dryocola clanedunensis TaxID=2925396 RepID=UPI0022F0B663|nr:Spy/CpxP family protein refolding chaperone [Dryocola clanedunensis]MCT4706197.1 Spy/CpxP family protein refolding chaperone [Dryocola clanedunensis]MCT4712945.1 Spy/CpxP family protein refolding chaperone [Dryocola clanedunensis]